MITPTQVEKRLVDLSAEVDLAHSELATAEEKYFVAKSNFEIAIAKARLDAPTQTGLKLTVQNKDDLATLATQTELKELAISEAIVKSARANVNRLRTQVDIARSVGTSVRISMDTV